MPRQPLIKANVIARIHSDSEPGRVYVIGATADGELYCDCNGYKFRRHCRHVREAASGWLATLDSLALAAKRMREQAERVAYHVDPSVVERTQLEKVWRNISAAEKEINSMVQKSNAKYRNENGI